MIYFYIFILLILFSWIEVKGLLKKSQKKLQVTVVFVLVFTAGLRYETGVDWAGYQYYFDNIVSFDKAYKFDNFKEIFVTLDLGYSLFNSIIKMFGGGLQVIFFIVSLISNLLLLKNLRNNTNYILTGFLIYYCLFFFIFDMSGLRQGLALQIVFYAYQFIEKRNLKNYLLFILLAGSIHWTAVLMIVLYFFAYKDFSRYYYLIIFLCLVYFMFKVEIIEKIIPNLDVLLRGNDLLSGKVTAYTTNETFSEAREWDLYSVFHCVRILFLIILIKNIKNKNRHIIFYSNLLILEFVCYFGLYELNEVSERLRFYFVLSELVIIPFIIYQYKSYFIKDLLFLYTVLMIFFNSLPFILQFPSTVAYHPYQNYIIYKVYDLPSTGPERLKKHAETH